MRLPRPRLPRVLPLLLLSLAGLGATSVAQRQAPLTKAYVSTMLTSRALNTKGSQGGVCVDETGTIYVANFRSAIYRVSPWGQASILTKKFTASSGNTIAPDGTLIQSDYFTSRVYAVNKVTGARQLLLSGGLNGPVGVVMAPTGELYVANCNANEIRVGMPPATTTSVHASSPLFNCPNGLALGEGGELFVINYFDDSLLRVDASGNVSLFATLGTQGLGGGHIARSGNHLYVSMFGGHTIWRVSLSGVAERIVGVEGEPGLADGSALRARLRFPNGIAVDPSGRFLYTNCLDGPRNTSLPGEMRLRRILNP